MVELLRRFPSHPWVDMGPACWLYFSPAEEAFSSRATESTRDPRQQARLPLSILIAGEHPDESTA